MNYEYTRYTISVLERHHDAVFAKKMNKKLIEGFNHGYLHSNFDGLCSILLEKYTDEVWNDFEAAFTDDKYLGFTAVPFRNLPVRIGSAYSNRLTLSREQSC